VTNAPLPDEVPLAEGPGAAGEEDDEVLDDVAVVVIFEQVTLDGTVALLERVRSAHWKSWPSPPSKINWMVTFAPL